MEVYVAFGLLAASVVVLFLLWSVAGPQFPGLAAGAILGLISGLALIFLVYFAQVPRFEVTPENDKFDPKSQDYYVHLRVRNTSWGFLGGGGAPKCRGEIIMEERSYYPKWATRPEPMLETGQAIQKGELMFRAGLPQSWLMELALEQDLWPGDVGVIDVAMKSVGDPKCYIHEAESYRAQDHKKNPLPPGTYPFTLKLKPAGRHAASFDFVLDNGGGSDPTSLRVRPVPSRGPFGVELAKECQPESSPPK